MPTSNLAELLSEYAQRYPTEQNVVQRFVELMQNYTNCYDRNCWAGHITGSAWVLNVAGDAVLLTHHRKLGIWVQLGGHSDGDPDTAAVALKEAEEESGLRVTALEPRIFDLDIHAIPARKGDPEHFHFDVRFAFQAAADNFVVSEESLDLAWVPIQTLEEYTQELSMLRMRDKWLNR